MSKKDIFSIQELQKRFPDIDFEAGARMAAEVQQPTRFSQAACAKEHEPVIRFFVAQHPTAAGPAIAEMVKAALPTHVRERLTPHFATALGTIVAEVKRQSRSKRSGGRIRVTVGIP